jgi:hypothetical protein
MIFVGHNQRLADFNVDFAQAIGTLNRLLEQTGAAMEHQKLFGKTRPGQRPQACTRTATENDGDYVVFHGVAYAA